MHSQLLISKWHYLFLRDQQRQAAYVEQKQQMEAKTAMVTMAQIGRGN